MAFQGTLDTVGLEDVFQLFAFSRKSGALHLTRSDHRGVVYFAEGGVYYATANPNEGLGKVLVRAGLVGAEQWSRVVTEARDEGVTQGQALMRQTADDGVALEALLRERVEDAVFQLIQWNEGSFELRDESHAFGPMFSFACDGLIDEAQRRLEVWERIKLDIPSTDMGVGLVRSLGEDVGEIVLSRSEWRVLATLTPGMDIAELAAALGQTEFATVQILHAMVGRSIVELHSREKLALLRDLAGHRLDVSSVGEVRTEPQPEPEVEQQPERQAVSSVDAPSQPEVVADPIPEPQVDAEPVPAAAAAVEPAENFADADAAGLGAAGDDGVADSAAGIAAVITATAANVEAWQTPLAADSTSDAGDEAELAGLFGDGGETKPKAKVSFAELAAAEDALAEPVAEAPYDPNTYTYTYTDQHQASGYYDQPVSGGMSEQMSGEMTGEMTGAMAGQAYQGYAEYPEHHTGEIPMAHPTGEVPTVPQAEAAGSDSELDKSLILRMIAGVRSL